MRHQLSDPPLPPGLTRQQALRTLASAFAHGGVDAAHDDARILLLAATGLSRVQLIADPDAPLGTATAARLTELARRRLAREPVSRILGRREFWGLEFAVTPAVLDPRPDSETVVEAAYRAMAGRRHAPLRLLDIGTGSGALLAALLTVFPQASGLGIDASQEAAALAALNLRQLGLADRALISVGDWAGAAASGFDLIVSNPPYIASADIATLDPEVRRYDPMAALDGGADGLTAYRALALGIGAALAPGGAICVEAGAGQAEAIIEIFAQEGYALAAIEHDLAGHARCLVFRAAG